MNKQAKKEAQDIVSRGKSVPGVGEALGVELDGGKEFLEELQGKLNQR